jgi:hypothetical protein
MCWEITIAGKAYDLVRDLADAMPNGLVGHPVYVRHATERGEAFEPNPDCCLCQIDLGATAALNGYEVERDGPMEATFRPPGAA